MVIARCGFVALHREGGVYIVTCDGYGVSGERFFADDAQAVAWFEGGLERGEFE